MNPVEYVRGQNSANACMLKGEDPKTLLAQAEGALDNEYAFSRGWINACEEEIRISAECDAEWERLEKLTPEQVREELHSYGYTDEMLNASIARMIESVKEKSNEQNSQ